VIPAEMHDLDVSSFGCNLAVLSARLAPSASFSRRGLSVLLFVSYGSDVDGSCRPF
jgi:hypothetical protein